MKRRSLLALGAVSGAILLVAGGSMALLEPGWQDGALSPASRDVFSGVSRALLEGALPAGHDEAAIEALLERINRLVEALPPHAQSELSQLLALLASVPGRRALAGIDDPWHVATVPQVQQGLQSMRVSGLSLRRQAYQALHDIVDSAYYSDPGTWTQLGYPGPLDI